MRGCNFMSVYIFCGEGSVLSRFPERRGKGHYDNVHSIPAAFFHSVLSESAQVCVGDFHVSTHITLMDNNPEIAFFLVSWMRKEGGRERKDPTKKNHYPDYNSGTSSHPEVFRPVVPVLVRLGLVASITLTQDVKIFAAFWAHPCPL